ncbi:MAG: hypothetical protein QMD80_04240 [archaeon]|nr:hypothetical protein [archaeon]
MKIAFPPQRACGSKSGRVIAIAIILLFLLLPVAIATPTIMTHHVTVIDSSDHISVYVRTSEIAEITLERSVPLKVAEHDIRYTKANYKIIGLNCVVGKSATFHLQPLSREEDIVIPVTLRYGNETRSFTYTILGPAKPASELLPPPPPEEETQPQLTTNGFLLAILAATAVLSIFLIALSFLDLKRKPLLGFRGGGG